MRKIFYQWAGVGILALIGWGVDLMPSNTSWIPSGIIWGIAFMWLVSTLIYWLKNRHKKSSGSSQKIQPTIGIDAEESFINAPGAKISNQDISIKSKKSTINIPSSEIKDDRQK
jgi:hypothetical protein